MRGLSACLLFLLCLGCAPSVPAATGRILKVLPQYLDHQGRASLSPSLYDRDAYQAHLQRNPGLRSTICFRVHWKASGFGATPLRLAVELRGSRGDWRKPSVVARTVKPSHWWGRWTSITFPAKVYDQTGGTVAWRVTLWAGDRQLSQQQSFLW